VARGAHARHVRSMSTSPVHGELRQGARVLHYTRHGEGPAVLALHGLPGTCRDYARFAETLAARGLCTVALDLPGFGESSPPAQPAWHGLAAAVDALVAELALGPVTLLAHSFGSHVALRVAAHNPAVRALALLAPAGLRPHRAVRSLGPRAFVGALSQSRLGRAVFHAGLRRSPLGRGTARPSSDLALALLASADFTRAGHDARALRMPVLAARSDDDRVVEPAVVDELVAAIHGASALRFADGGHAPQRAHGEAIANAIAALAR
jgi:pimeloyl-ACP methyl ester carboxylesterase